MFSTLFWMLLGKLLGTGRGAGVLCGGVALEPGAAGVAEGGGVCEPAVLWADEAICQKSGPKKMKSVAPRNTREVGRPNADENWRRERLG